MRKLITVILMATLLIGCDSARIKQLEKENAMLRQELDSINKMAEEAAKFAKDRYDQARKEGDAVMDSVIIARNLKVVKAYISCGDADVGQDLERSVDLLEEKLKDLGIEVYKLRGIYPEDYDCGYELAHGKRRKMIQGAMTDYDLALDIEKFYDVSMLK